MQIKTAKSISSQRISTLNSLPLSPSWAMANAAYELAKVWPNGEAIMLMLETDASRSELLGLKWVDLDCENHYIHINQGLTTYKDTDINRNMVSSEGLKNKYRNRTVPIMDDYLWERLESMNRTAAFKGAIVQTEYLFLATEYHSKVKIQSGEALHFDIHGNITRDIFDDINLYGYGCGGY